MGDTTWARGTSSIFLMRVRDTDPAQDPCVRRHCPAPRDAQPVSPSPRTAGSASRRAMFDRTRSVARVSLKRPPRVGSAPRTGSPNFSRARAGPPPPSKLPETREGSAEPGSGARASSLEKFGRELWRTHTCVPRRHFCRRSGADAVSRPGEVSESLSRHATRRRMRHIELGTIQPCRTPCCARVCLDTPRVGACATSNLGLSSRAALPVARKSLKSPQAVSRR